MALLPAHCLPVVLPDGRAHVHKPRFFMACFIPILKDLNKWKMGSYGGKYCQEDHFNPHRFPQYTKTEGKGSL